MFLNPSCPEDWTAWWNDVVDTAKNYEVWDFIDPEGDSVLEEPEEPAFPFRATTTRSESADGPSYTLLLQEYEYILLPRYNRRMKKYRKQKKALQIMNTYIRDGAAYETSFYNARTPREKLQELKLRG
ncbi:hypothetical protein L249_1751 [Ophiocordyceps polyrhachis-furcata BCC 54312]|uniref:Uncharacterized protein n=1 Tax=Ophiocordyceps polyrhachis-furcata BCC 54312 TaxID=1330021 RepID=A0A367LRA3_9HYPO|nr:hypothetical protein L249_1751 [Ophiocordyceps polyrhachis-furcata BCC 54312]